ncbi:MAG TPA: hypothetical protein VLW88_01120 [Hyphomicrobium sp.]|nr:hypothetical protein [Hyphomicrobium sp.]
MLSRAMIASAVAFGSMAGSAEAAPAPADALNAKSVPSVIAPVFYRCIVPVCGHYRCVWVNRCRRPWWW